MRKFLLPLFSMVIVFAAAFGAKAQTGVDNYVSASGFMLFHAPSYYTGEDGYCFDFEADYAEGRFLDLTTIDADGDSYNWQLSSIGGGYGHNASDGVAMSYSYNAYAGALNPDNYLVLPEISISQECHMVKFFGAALDEAYPADHFGLAISTTDNINASSFSTIQEWTMTAKQGGWHEYSVDLSNYIGQEVFIAIRHFNSADKFCLCIDDITVGDGNLDPLSGCRIFLDGQQVANNLTGVHYLLNTDGFADGSSHSTVVRATYQSGAVMEEDCDWTFRASSNFDGSPSGLHTSSDGASVTLSWTLPTMSVPYVIDELYYDFSDSTMSDLTLIDANHDGRNFRLYPYGGYGSGNCLKSDSWVAGGVGNVDPDNYVVTPRVTPSENGRISFMAVDCDMPGTVTVPEHFGVAISTTGNTDAADFTTIAEWNSTGTYAEYTADLSAYENQPIYVAIRHFNTTGDCYFLYVDNIRLTGIEAEVQRPAKGALVYSNDELIATLTHGETSYTHNVNRYTADYCIRIVQDGSDENGQYLALAEPQCADAELECKAAKNLEANYDGDKVTLSWERELYTGFEEDPQGWSFLDVDGDGLSFGIYNVGGMDADGTPNTSGTNPSLISLSYSNESGALTPDNYAFMPLIEVLPNASIEFYASGMDPNYPVESFGVAVASADGSTISTIREWTTSYPYARYTADLTDYAGQSIYLGFHHFTTNANYAIVIDNITVTNAVWAGTYSYTDHYNIYRSLDGVNYNLIGIADAGDVTYDDNDIQSVNQYYKVMVVNTIAGGHCESDAALAVDGIHDFVHVTTDGLEEVQNNVTLYPNPTNGIVNIMAKDIKTVTVINSLGQVVEIVNASGDNVVVDLSQYGNGLYMIRVESGEGVSVGKIAKGYF